GSHRLPGVRIQICGALDGVAMDVGGLARDRVVALRRGPVPGQGNRAGVEGDAAHLWFGMESDDAASGERGSTDTGKSDPAVETPVGDDPIALSPAGAEVDGRVDARTGITDITVNQYP